MLAARCSISIRHETPSLLLLSLFPTLHSLRIPFHSSPLHSSMESITFADLHLIAPATVTPHGVRGGSSPFLSRTFFYPSRCPSPVSSVAFRHRPARAAITTNSVPVSLFLLSLRNLFVFRYRRRKIRCKFFSLSYLCFLYFCFCLLMLVLFGLFR